MFLSYTGICVWYMCKLPTLFLNVSTCCDLDKNDMKCSCFVLMFVSLLFVCWVQVLYKSPNPSLHTSRYASMSSTQADLMAVGRISYACKINPMAMFTWGYQGLLNASHLNGTHPVFFFFWGGGAISSCSDVCQVPSLKLKASLHLKIDGWNTRPSFLGVWGLFSGWSVIVSGSECISGVCMGMLESMEKKWGISLGWFHILTPVHALFVS